MRIWVTLLEKLLRLAEVISDGDRDPDRSWRKEKRSVSYFSRLITGVGPEVYPTHLLLPSFPSERETYWYLGGDAP